MSDLLCDFFVTPIANMFIIVDMLVKRAHTLLGTEECAVLASYGNQCDRLNNFPFYSRIGAFHLDGSLLDEAVFLWIGRGQAMMMAS